MRFKTKLILGFFLIIAVAVLAFLYRDTAFIKSILGVGAIIGSLLGLSKSPTVKQLEEKKEKLEVKQEEIKKEREEIKARSNEESYNSLKDSTKDKIDAIKQKVISKKIESLKKSLD